MTSLELRNISKGFKSGKVLDDVSLSVNAGEIVVVFGPSGTGKTVLLRIVAGVHYPDAGTVAIDGEDVTEASPEARGVGMAFQNFALFPHFSTFENIASPLEAREAPARELLKELIEWFIDDVVDALGSRSKVEYAFRILEEGSSADRQLDAFRRRGNLNDVVDQLIRETREDVVD